MGNFDDDKLAAIRKNLANSTVQQQRIDLTKTEQRRAKKLEALLSKLKEGKNVQNRDLETWLTANEYKAMQAEWDLEKAQRIDTADIPADLKEYDAVLKRGKFNYNRGLSYRRKGIHQTASMFFDKAESIFEDALEHLRDVLERDTTLQVWLDRTIDWESGGNVGANHCELPMLVTSRSVYKQAVSGYHQKRSKHDIKLEAVEAALNALYVTTTTEPDNKRTEKLDALMKLHKLDALDDDFL